MESLQLSLSSANGNLLNINEKTISQAMSSYMCSTKYLRHVVPLSMFYIVYNRVDYDPENYADANIKDWKYVILKKNSKHASLNRLYDCAKGAMEALDKGCLNQLYLKILDNNETVEYYRYSFQYCKNPVFNKPKGTSNEVIKISSNFFKSLSSLGELDKISSTATLSLELIVTNKPTFKLLHFEVTDKSDVYDPDKDKESVALLDLGGINTKYHKMRAHCKIKSIESVGAASTIADSDVGEVLEDEPLDRLDPVPMELCEDCPTIEHSNNLNNTRGFDTDNYANIASSTWNRHDVDKDPVPPKKAAKKDTPVKKQTREKKENIIKRKVKEVPLRTPPIIADAADSTKRSTTDLIAQKIISCKDMSAGKGINKSMTIFGNTTVETVEEEITVPPLQVPSKTNINLQVIQAEVHAEPVKKSKAKRKVEDIDGDRLVIKKSKTKTKVTNKKSTDGKELNTRKSKLTTVEESSNPQLIKNPEEKQVRKRKGKIAIITDISIEPIDIIPPIEAPPINIDSEHSSETVQSELYINNELVPRLNRRGIRHPASPSLMKKSKSSFKDVPKKKKIQENFTKITSNAKDKRNDSIFDDATFELDQEISNKRDVVKETINEEKQDNESSNDRHPLTPKNTAAKCKSTNNLKKINDSNLAKKSKENIEDAKVILQKCRESPSSKLLETESYDSTTLGKKSKRNSTPMKQLEPNSKELGSSESVDVNSMDLSTELGGAAKLYCQNKQRTTHDDDVRSISSTDSDMSYINNRIKYG